ncbi:MAG: hypothetical protein OEY01_03390 [Desulfobulbaceae bacterium]|nr:hypothetical protein [Desulfobulbaceae bacterium]
MQQIRVTQDYDAPNPLSLSDFEFIEFSSREQRENYEEMREEDLEGREEIRPSWQCDRYKHGDVIWSLSGEGSQCRWDTALGAGILLFNGTEEIDPDDLDDHAREFLKLYTEWCNGYVYYVEVEMDGEVQGDGRQYADMISQNLEERGVKGDLEALTYSALRNFGEWTPIPNQEETTTTDDPNICHGVHTYYNEAGEKIVESAPVFICPVCGHWQDPGGPCLGCEAIASHKSR